MGHETSWRRWGLGELIWPVAVVQVICSRPRGRFATPSPMAKNFKISEFREEITNLELERRKEGQEWQEWSEEMQQRRFHQGQLGGLVMEFCISRKVRHTEFLGQMRLFAHFFWSFAKFRWQMGSCDNYNEKIAIKIFILCSK